MTIASAFNDIAVAQGGTASKSGSIASAIDALNDALAGSDQPAAQTIEDAVTLLGKHIGSGGGVKVGTVVLDMVNMTLTTLDKSFFYPCKTEEAGGVYAYVGDFDADPVTQAAPGTPVAVDMDAIASPADFVIVDMSSEDPLLPLPNKNTYMLVGVDSSEGQ